MSDSSMPQRDIGEIIMTAINEVGGLEGASLDDIEKYLKSASNDVPDSERIQSILDNAVVKGFVLKMDNGKYKINGSQEQTKPISESANTGAKALPKLHENDLEKARRLSDEVTKHAKEKAQEAERAIRKAAENKNRNADSDVGNVSSGTEKKCANTSHSHDDCKNETCADDCAKKCAQKVERTVDSAAQDAKQIADSGSKNVGSTKTKEEKEKVPLSDEDDVKDIEKMMKDIKMKK